MDVTVIVGGGVWFRRAVFADPAGDFFWAKLEPHECGFS